MFSGWHLYRRQVNAERSGPPGERWGWIQHAMGVMSVERCLRAGEKPLAHYDFGAGETHLFVEWFVENLPGGIVVDPGPYGSWCNPRPPPPVFARRLILDNAIWHVESVRRHGQAFVEGAPGHPVKNWTEHDYRWCANLLLKAGALRRKAHAIKAE